MPKKIKIHEIAAELGHVLLKHRWRCTVAESCTGGGVSAAITAVAGSSQWFDRGFVTYSNESKIELLNIRASEFLEEGAVSEVIVRAMAEGAIERSHADVSVAISGVAGPGGGSLKKPVGTVWVAYAGVLEATTAECYFFKGDRDAIREQAIQVALQGLIQRLSEAVQKRSVERYFFALWPANNTANAIYKTANEAHECPQEKRVSLENLHMTLMYLGCVTGDFLKRIQEMASQVGSPSFILELSQKNYWSKSHVRFISSAQTPPSLTHLVNCLKPGLIKEGFKPEQTLFIPHVTIARQCTKGYELGAFEPLSWPVDDFCLVKSTATTHGSQYEIIGRWPLR